MFVDMCLLKIFSIDIYGLFLFGIVKLISGLPKSEEYLPEELPGIFTFWILNKDKILFCKKFKDLKQRCCQED